MRMCVSVRMGCGHDGNVCWWWCVCVGIGGGGGWEDSERVGRWAGSGQDGGLKSQRTGNDLCFFPLVCLPLISVSSFTRFPSAAPSASASASPRQPPTLPPPLNPPPAHPPRKKGEKKKKKNHSWSPSGATTGSRLLSYPLHGGLRSDWEAPSGRFTPSSGGRLLPVQPS